MHEINRQSSPSNHLRPARRFTSRRTVIAVLVVTVAISLIGYEQWWTVAVQRRLAAAPAALLDRKVSIHVHGLPVKEAVAKVKDAIGAPIEAHWDSMIAHHLNLEEPIWLDFDSVTTGQILLALTEQMRGWEGVAGYDVQGNSIVIAPDAEMKCVVRIYDVADLINGATPSRESNELAGAITACLEPRYWYCGVVLHAQQRRMHVSGNQLFIAESMVNHARLAEFFSALRTATPDGTGPAIPRCRVLQHTSTRTSLCFYDVRDLADHAEFTFRSKDGIPDTLVTGTGAVGIAIGREVRGGNDTVGHWHIVGGCVVLEQSPECHDAVRKLLAQLRSGNYKPIEGFRLSATPITPVATAK